MQNQNTLILTNIVQHAQRTPVLSKDEEFELILKWQNKKNTKFLFASSGINCKEI